MTLKIIQVLEHLYIVYWIKIVRKTNVEYIKTRFYYNVYKIVIIHEILIKNFIISVQVNYNYCWCCLIQWLY